MINLNKALLILCVLVIFPSCNAQKSSNNSDDISNSPRNVILLIGDGMGLSQVSSSFYFGDHKPNFERFKHIGLIKTSSESDLITDSAAAATSFASGIKTYNGAIGVDIDTLSVKTIVEIVSPLNISTGIISTSSITHATPAAFYGHVKLRRMEDEIASQLTSSSIDFFAGGGRNFFFKRKDEVNYGAILAEKGFVLDTVALSQPDNFNLQHKFGFLLADHGMPKMSQNRGDFLPEATQLGLEYLSQNKEGFFLMIEGAQIDWGGHANDTDYIIGEVNDFDKVIGKVLDFAKSDGNTLVIVTADHETGGLALSSTGSNYNQITATFSTSGHTATLIPVFAFGPGSEEFIGIYENTEIFHKIMKVTKW